MIEKIYDIYTSETCVEASGKLNKLYQNDKIQQYTDKADNIILHQGGKGKKIVIASIINKIQLCICCVKDNKAEFEVIGKVKKESLSDMVVYLKEEPVGIIRCKNEKEDDKSYFIDIFGESEVNAGDICTIKNDIKCKGDNLYGFNVKSFTPYYSALEFVSKNNTSVNDIYFTLSFSEGGVISAISDIKPDIIYVIYCVNETDDFKISKGAGIVYKDTNEIIDKPIRERIKTVADTNQITNQIFIGRENRVLEKIDSMGCGAEIGAICIPVKYFESRCEVANIRDIEELSRLIAEIIK